MDETIPVYDHCLHAKCKLIEFSEDFTHAEKVREAKRNVLNEAEVILTTCANSSCSDLDLIDPFSAVIIDEACQVISTCQTKTSIIFLCSSPLSQRH